MPERDLAFVTMVQETENERNALAERFAQAQAALETRRKVLEQAERRAQEQLWCLEDELDQQGKLELFHQAQKVTVLEQQLTDGHSSLALTLSGSAEASSNQGS